MLEKRYEPKKVEAGKYDFWLKKGYFTSGDISKERFSMVIPPPNVTGKLHIGHAWDNTIQDIICRYKRLKGYDVSYLPGMDHAGIATQAKVMGRLTSNGVDVTKISREEFLKAAWGWKDEYAKSIHEQWQKLGLSLDYPKERFTLDEGLNYAVRKVFVDLYNKGLIYQGERIINWDPVQKTALSNIEVIHQDDEGYMYYFLYPIEGTKEALTVATTRPETMFGDVCVVVNPKDKRYRKYVGKKVLNPANDGIIPIIEDEYVDMEFGTGAMKCTPAHDPNDFIIGKKYHLPMPIIFNKDATMNDKCGLYKGLDRFVCREKLIKDIAAKGYFVKKEKLVHPVGHSERTNAVIEPMLSKQWFLKMRPLADMAIANQKTEMKVNFVPSRFEHIFLNWMNDVEDWCISRQLWWGHRIPAYYHKTTGEVVVSMDPPKDKENYVQDEDVLDTWFSSQLWPFSTWGWPNKTKDLERYFPTDTLVTGYDIIFFWVSRMITQSLEVNKVRPFKDCVIHGLVRDELGRKMSKSLGNGIDPIVEIDKYGADALRYFLSSNSTPGQDIRYIPEKVEASMNFLNKIWNSARFALSYLEEGFTPKGLHELSFSPMEQYIINRYELTIKNVTSNMEKYDFNAASTHLYNFVYDDFCSNYLEMSKVVLNGEDETKKEVCKQVLFFILKGIIILISPYTPFIAEELYLALPKHLESINLEVYPIYDKKLIDNKLDEQVTTLFSIIKDVRNYKINNKLAPNYALNLHLDLKETFFNDFMTYLKRFTFSNLILDNCHSGEHFSYVNASMCIENTLSNLEIKDKLIKDIALEESEIKRCNNMLNNPNFISKAPKEKIDIEKAKLAEHLSKLDDLNNKLLELTNKE